MAKGTLRVVVAGDTGPLKKALGGATGTIGKFAGGIGAAVAGAAAFSVKSFADFDKAMTSSLAIMGDVSESMRKDMSDAAREVAKTTRFSAVEAAESYFFLASAGLDAAQSIEALPRVAAFAQAGNFEMARATDLLTDAQSALGLASDDAAENLENMTRVSDVLVKANTLANASVEEFSTALTQKAGAALRTLGVDVEEGVAALAVFADQGIKGERAGTTLTRTLEGLTENARKNAGAFDSLGVSVFDADGELRNISEIVGDLETGLEGMNTEQKEAALAQLGFNRQARDGILALLGNSEALADYEEDLRKAGGTTDEVADKQLQNFWDQLGLIKDQFIDIGLSIGEKLMPHLETFLGWIQEKMPEIKSTIEGVITAFEILFTGQSDRSAQFSEDVGQGFRDMVADGEVTRTWITDDLIPAFESIREWWEDNGPKIQQAASSTWDGVSTNTGLAFDNLGGMFKTFEGATENDWDKFWAGVGQTAESGMELANNTVFALLDFFVDQWVDDLNTAFRFIKGWWDNTVAPFFAALPGNVMDLLRGLPGMLGRLGRETMSGLRSGLSDRWAAVSGFLGRLPGRIAGVFTGLPGRLYGIGWSAVQGLWNGFSARWDSFVGWVSTLPGAGIVSNIAGQLGITSPSKVMATEIGAPAVEGIEMGMESRLGDLQRLAAEIPELMRAAEADSMRRLASVTSDPEALAARTTTAADGGPSELRMVVEPRGGNSGMAHLIAEMVRKGEIRLSADGKPVRVGK